MRTLRLIVIAHVVLAATSQAQTVVPAGTVSGTWDTAGSPYLIQGDITIPAGYTLAIDPGVSVVIQGHYKLTVQGRLLAEGSAADSISFSIHDTTGFHDAAVPDGGWLGIRFEYTSWTNDSSKIRYCNLQYGKATGDWPDNGGGAICVNGFDKLIIANCLIANNMAVADGGGVALWNADAELIGNTISSNSAQFGGGISCFESNPRLTGNLIAHNTAEQGGGMVCNEYSNPIIRGTTFDGNDAMSGGGIICWNNSRPVLDSVILRHNKAAWGGGGIHTHNCDLEISRCHFSENDASVVGGAVSFVADTSALGIPHQLSVQASSFLDNNSGAGGGAFVRNWAWTPLIIEATIEECIFTGNTSERGAGLIVEDCIVTLANSEFADNIAGDRAGAAGFSLGTVGTVRNSLFFSNRAEGSRAGGVIVSRDAKVDFINCTFAENSALHGGGLTVGPDGSSSLINCIVWGNAPDQLALDTLDDQGGTLGVHFCDVQDGRDSVKIAGPACTLTWGNGNIDLDPLFEDPGNSDFHLQDASPCVGAAIDTIEINGTVHCCPTSDRDGNPRPDPVGSMPDMGAYESPSASPVGVGDPSAVAPAEFQLQQNYPNPFNPSTIIEYGLPLQGRVTLKIFNLLGQEVATLVDEVQPAGYTSVRFDAGGLPSGVYVCRLVARDFVQVKKMVLLR